MVGSQACWSSPRSVQLIDRAVAQSLKPVNGMPDKLTGQLVIRKAERVVAENAY